MMEQNRVLAPVLSSWLSKDGDDADVVLSSRVRIARNFEDELFPFYEQRDAVVERVRRVVDNSFLLFKMEELGILDRALLVEKHLISPYLMNESEHGAVFISPTENLSIMTNEEDHLRVQCLEPGLGLFVALENALRMTEQIEQAHPFAFHKEFGYLTSCITNLGTGLRASVMVHLPGLVATKRLKKVVDALRSIGFVIRGIYGEGSRSESNIFQISNQITLGKTEEEIVSDLTQIMEQVIMQERVSRTNLKQKFHISLEDRVYRAYGVLKNSRVISMRESGEAISDLRLGIELGYFEHISRQKINELLIFSQPAFLRKARGQDMNELEEKVIRASVIRDILEEV
ncbi:ATP:guanido phosphotransferase [Listeria aquatica FSL S10-1188]|uniref:Protein-arginine kinase n=2 Tax=Listeria aquatica TaxID=1494960 RepID=W7AUD7_9LIST|nr:ATP--guanido phosphotransferase [Listeria aquatica]EUJ16830.1 ATP:guanido phosphotransferase [Listeria aquatica FSL S10-1188]